MYGGGVDQHQQHQQNQQHQFQQQQHHQQIMRQPSASSTTDFHHQPMHYPHHSYDAHADNFAAKRIRKIGQRRAVDYTSTVVRYMQIRMFQRDSRDRTVLEPNPAAAIDVC